MLYLIPASAGMTPKQLFLTGDDKGDREAFFIMGNPIGIFSGYWGPRTLAQSFATGSLAARRDALTILNTFQAGLEIRGWKRDRLYLMVAAYHRALTFRQKETVEKLGFAIAHELQQKARRLDKILASLLFPTRAQINRFTDFDPASLEALLAKETRIEIGAQSSGAVASRQKPADNQTKLRADGPPRQVPGTGPPLVRLLQEKTPEALLLIARAVEESPSLIRLIHGYFLTTRDGATFDAIKEMVRGLNAKRAIEEAQEWLAVGEPLLDGPEHPFLTLQTWAKLGNPAAVQEIISLAIAGNPGARFCLKQLASEGTDRRVVNAVHEMVRSGDPKTVGEFAEALTDMVVYAWDKIALETLARAASRDIDAAEGLCKALAQLNPSPFKNHGLQLLRGLDVQTIAERALTEAEAVMTLHRLAEFGHDDARVALRNLDVEQLAAELGGEIIGNKLLRIIKALRWAAQTGGNRRAAEVLRNYDVSKLERLAKGDIAEYGDTVDALEDLVNVGHRGAERALESLKKSGDPETRAMAASALRHWRDRMRQQ